MKTIDNEKIKQIVESLLFEPNNEVINNILDNWNELTRSIKLFDQFDLSNIKPMTHINETYLIDFLRDDIPNTTNSITKEDILKNAKNKDQDYILLTKVVD